MDIQNILGDKVIYKMDTFSQNCVINVKNKEIEVYYLKLKIKIAELVPLKCKI